jgi:hypothetical protein
MTFWLAVRLDTRYIRGSEPYLSRFYFPVVVATSISLRDLRENFYSKYPWSPGDLVDLQYFNISEQRLLPLICIEHRGLLFFLNVAGCFGHINLYPCAT